MSAKGDKQKKMTAREKAERARIRKELREKGVLPPPKKPLNRKAFCEEARGILTSESELELLPYIWWGFIEMLAHAEYPAGTLSKEAVGAAKVIQLAKARRDFELAHKKPGEHGTYTVGELYEATKDIYKA